MIANEHEASQYRLLKPGGYSTLHTRPLPQAVLTLPLVWGDSCNCK
jgi:hypothetical protein